MTKVQDDVITLAVTKVKDEEITLEDTWKLPIDIIRKRFVYAYCRTAHSMQGKSIKNQ